MNVKTKIVQQKRQQDGEDEETWAAREGVPSFDEPFVQKYLDGRDALISQENRQRSDHAFRQTLSPMAAEACSIVADIRTEEQQTLWQGEPGSDIFPGTMFALAKERMESSKLFAIVKKMPKGALLHCHLGAMTNYDYIIAEALETKGLCISADGTLSSEVARDTTPFVLKYSSKAQSASNVALPWSESYTHNDLIPIAQAADSFPNGGRAGFTKWLKSRMTISREESLKHHEGQNKIWRKMASYFPVIDSLMRYEPLLRKFIRRMLQELNEDGVRWVDIRTDFVMPFYREGSEQPDEGFEGFMEALEETIDEFKASEEGKGFWGARLIWTGLRIFDRRTIVEDMKECIRMKQLFPDLICGFDFVGQEDLGRPLAELTPEIFWFKKRCVEEGVDLPFFFHAGETSGTGNDVDENLFDAVLLGTRRIGHGFSLFKHPLLIDMVKEKKILVESCPISNEVLRLTGSILSHPHPALLARGVACSLCNDDPAMQGQGTSGLTHDFYQALQGWESLGLEGLASMAENSVRYASFNDCTAKEWAQEIKDGAYGHGERAQRMKEWAMAFEEFCSWIVLEFGPERDLSRLLKDGEDAE